MSSAAASSMTASSRATILNSASASNSLTPVNSSSASTAISSARSPTVSTAVSSSRPTTSSSSNSTTQQKPLPNPQTPRSASQTTSIQKPQPGTWRHPHIDDITRRQNRSVLTSENVRSATQYAIYLVASLLCPTFVQPYYPRWFNQLIDPYYDNIIFAIRLFFFTAFLYSFRPLIQSKDEVDDIPLTPSQRALLGLKPSGTPLTPGSQILTPPRYSRSATPRSSFSDRPTSRSPLSGSPLEARGRSGSIDRSTSQSGRAGSGSPFGGSPLIQKALSASTGRRLSFDTTGGSSSSGLPSTPTPAMGSGKASVGLNNKWLYERSRNSLDGRTLFS